jgi:hypothetical protein
MDLDRLPSLAVVLLNPTQGRIPTAHLSPIDHPRSGATFKDVPLLERAAEPELLVEMTLNLKDPPI